MTSGKKPSSASEREAREAAALRENLRKRKQQQQAKAEKEKKETPHARDA